MKIKSLEELQKIKEEFSKNLKWRDSKKRGRIVVAMGTCGISAGAKETLRAIVDELDKNSIDDIAVIQSGCMGLCEVEPTVEVQIGEEEPVVYGHVDEKQARRIVKEHIINGKILSDILVKRGKV
ncbi:(2Fe-2S) ferredoxin domain-containing protein [Mesoaciditoga lauensis]|uniref:(2Fe-2S) ferredoxin domain-containing protein n=1 Tax=Mesoaciditoga lauensis TaxID=1495039 RepID=UPI000567550A|nr:NADH dehydrogenase [Mesoaciditoga lauensis]